MFLSGLEKTLSDDVLVALLDQFTNMETMLSLGQALGASGSCGGCGACMDKTDGIGQSISESGEASKVAFIIQNSALRIPTIVELVSLKAKVEPLAIVFDGCADFLLVGTLTGDWTSERASVEFGHSLEIIGRVKSGTGLWLEDTGRKPLSFRGWNYFQGGSSDGLLSAARNAI